MFPFRLINAGVRNKEIRFACLPPSVIIRFQSTRGLIEICLGEGVKSAKQMISFILRRRSLEGITRSSLFSARM